MVTSYTSNLHNPLCMFQGATVLRKKVTAFLATETAFLISSDALEPIAECNETFYKAILIDTLINPCTTKTLILTHCVKQSLRHSKNGSKTASH